MLTSKEKIIKYLRYKGLSQDKFSRDCEVSSGFLRQGKSFSIDLLKIIRDKYPDLNMHWLLYNEGEMIIDVDNVSSLAAEPPLLYESKHKERLIELQAKVIILHEALQKANTTIEELRSK